MITRLILLIATTCIALTTSSFSHYDKAYSIFIKEYNYIFTPQRLECNDTLTDKLDDGRKLKIFLFDCKGKMHVQCFKGNKKVEEGEYVNSLDLLKKYSYGVNGVTGKRRVFVREYYQPLRSGDWLFFNSNGNIRLKRKYIEGLEQN
jgi:hypothetical protein